MSIHKTVSANIKELCKQQNISYSELARRAKMPLSSLQKILYVQSLKEPRVSTLMKIAKALKISVDELLK